MKTLLALATLKIVARAFFYLRQRIRQRQDNARQRQDNDIVGKKSSVYAVFRGYKTTRQRNRISNYIFIYITTIYTLFFSILLHMPYIIFIFYKI